MASEEERLIIIASSFPELAGKRGASVGHSKVRPGAMAGFMASVGTHGVGAMMMGGASYTGRVLADSYKGCSEWQQVLRLWRDNPLLGLDAEQEAFLHDQVSE